MSARNWILFFATSFAVACGCLFGAVGAPGTVIQGSAVKMIDQDDVDLMCVHEICPEGWTRQCNEFVINSECQISCQDCGCIQNPPVTTEPAQLYGPPQLDDGNSG